MDIVAMLIPIVSGVIGGNVAGSALKKYSLGPIGNSLAGLLGGAGGGALLGMMGADPTPLTTQAGGLDVGALISGIAGGGVGGGIFMSIIGVIKDKFVKPAR